MHFKEKSDFRVKIQNVQKIEISANDLVEKLLTLSETETVCFLDSCGVNHLDSHLLIAGINPLEIFELSNESATETLEKFDKILSDDVASIFTLSYDFGLKLEKIKPRKKEYQTFSETDIFIATFDCLIIHDYNTKTTFLKGNSEKFENLLCKIKNTDSPEAFKDIETEFNTRITSNLSKGEYLIKIKEIQELIKAGETYQTNLTQQFHAKLADNLTPQNIFWHLRENHPAPFSSFIKRTNDFVVSISPERFVKVENKTNQRLIKTSPIKGTRKRGDTIPEDAELKNELLNSKKDRAENTMIVDLLRNDLGRICEFGSVKVEKLCDLEEHPSLFHLVSTISGSLKKDANYGDIVKAIFPCGSITGCPKISTMKIIDDLETSNRGLSMGAIGYSGFDSEFDLNVAIRTLVIRDQEAIFNVGGGIVIDSDPFNEYDESLLKAKAIFEALQLNK